MYMHIWFVVYFRRIGEGERKIYIYGKCSKKESSQETYNNKKTDNVMLTVIVVCCCSGRSIQRMRYPSSSSSYVFLQKLASLRNTTTAATIFTTSRLCTTNPSITTTSAFVANRYNTSSCMERRKHRYHHHVHNFNNILRRSKRNDNYCINHHHHHHHHSHNNSKALFATSSTTITTTCCHRHLLLLQQQYKRPLLFIRHQSYVKHEQQQQQQQQLPHNDKIQSNASKQRGCIQQIEEMIDKVTQYYQQKYDINLLHERMDPSTFTTTTTNSKMKQMIHLKEREVINIVRYLYQRIQSMKERNICLYCWFQQDLYCICNTIREQQQQQQRLQQEQQQLFVLPKYIQNIYIITHYKEIGLISDTMKLLYLLYPQHCNVVVGNVLLEQQHKALQQMNRTLRRQQQQIPITTPCNTTNTTTNKTENTDETLLSPDAAATATTTTALVLFPSENAQTFASYYHNQQRHHHHHQQQQQQEQPVVDDDSTINTHNHKADMKYDIIVIDATWEQARRLYNRHIVPFLSSACSNIVNIQLSEKSLASLQQQNQSEEGCSNDKTETRKWNIGQQIRPHPIPVREISTAHAVQILLHDIIRIVDNQTFQDSTDSSDNESNNSLTVHIQEQQKVFDQYHQLINYTALRQTGKEQWK